jgi:hypothetical protein
MHHSVGLPTCTTRMCGAKHQLEEACMQWNKCSHSQPHKECRPELRYVLISLSLSFLSHWPSLTPLLLSLSPFVLHLSLLTMFLLIVVFVSVLIITGHWPLVIYVPHSSLHPCLLPSAYSICLFVSLSCSITCSLTCLLSVLLIVVCFHFSLQVIVFISFLIITSHWSFMFLIRHSSLSLAVCLSVCLSLSLSLPLSLACLLAHSLACSLSCWLWCVFVFHFISDHHWPLIIYVPHLSLIPVSCCLPIGLSISLTWWI